MAIFEVQNLVEQFDLPLLNWQIQAAKFQYEWQKTQVNKKITLVQKGTSNRKTVGGMGGGV